MRCCRHDDGFSLIELLVAIIIIGILSAIAVPLFLNQRAKAHDTAAKADLRALAVEIQSRLVEHDGPTIIGVSQRAVESGATTGTLTASDTPTEFYLRVNGGEDELVLRASAGVRLVRSSGGYNWVSDDHGQYLYEVLDPLGGGGLATSTDWCLNLTALDGAVGLFRYSPQRGIEAGLRCQ